jgi:hypothetical protein
MDKPLQAPNHNKDHRFGRFKRIPSPYSEVVGGWSSLTAQCLATAPSGLSATRTEGWVRWPDRYGEVGLQPDIGRLSRNMRYTATPELNPVVRRMSQILSGAQVTFCRLNRGVPRSNWICSSSPPAARHIFAQLRLKS